MGPLPLYLDHCATTPLDPDVFHVMEPWLGQAVGNPHAGDHVHGWSAEEAVERARALIARPLGVPSASVIFTSGATESNNLALFGMRRRLVSQGRRHLIVSTLEHACVRECMAAMEREGFGVTWVSPDGGGHITVETIVQALQPETGLVSVMMTSHELGTVQPVAAIAAFCRSHGIVFHCDAAQGGMLAEGGGGDLITLSAHKLYGPMGVGALVVKPAMKPHLTPLMVGGRQQGGLRPGTVPVSLAVGFGAAFARAVAGHDEDWRRLSAIRDRFLSLLNEGGVRYGLNGTGPRLPGSAHLRLYARRTGRPLSAASVIAALRNRLSISAGSACETGRRVASAALMAMGQTEDEALAALRIAFGRFSTEDDAEVAAQSIVGFWEKT